MINFDERFTDHVGVIEDARSLIPAIEQVVEGICASLRGGGKVLWMGNGGSAAEAQHLSTELIGHLILDRAAFASIALTADTSVLTAVGNDFGFADVFARQIQGLCNPGDVVIGLSTSGESANVVKGLKAGSDNGAVIVGFTGMSGGSVADVSDICFSVPSNDTQRVQEVHLLLGHLICEAVEEVFSTDFVDQ